MLANIILAIVIFALGFITGCFVFNNNKEKASKIADKVEKGAEKAVKKATAGVKKTASAAKNTTKKLQK